MSSKEKRNPPGKTKILKYLQDYRFNSILVRSFIIILSFLIGIFTIVMITVYGKMDSIITEEVGNMSINSLIKTRDRVDVVMEEVVKISGQLSLDEDIQKFMLPDTNELFDHTQTVNVKEKIEMYAGVFDYIDSIYVYSNKSKYIVTNDGGGKISEFEDTNWLENLTEREYEPARMISRVKNNSYPNLISYIQPLRLTQMQFLGGIIVNVDVDKLEELVISNIKDYSENLMIVDDRNNILFSSQQSYLRKKWNKLEFYKDIDYQSIDGYQIVNDGDQDYLVTIAPSDEFNWNYISITPMSAYEEYRDSIWSFYIALCIVGIMLSLIGAFFISVYCYKPVKKILDLVKNPDIYHLDFQEDTGLRKNETQEISLNIIRNLYSNRQMQEEMKEYTDIIDKAQLTALQAQISPHFLYNTLENIRWRAMELSHGDNDVSRIILNLSEMLRNSLDIDEQIISVKEEIHNAKLYVEILQLRYEDKLKVIWEIDEKVLDYPIVKVSLQPIIENSVYHGIKPLRIQGIITIRAYQKGESLVVEVEDNGIGMSSEEVTRLNEDMCEKYVLREDHIGIRNVNQRFRLLLGDEARIKVYSVENKGTKVVFYLPIYKI